MQARISDGGPETSLETSIGQGRPSPYSVVRAPRVPLLPRAANSEVNGLVTEVIRMSLRRREFMCVVFAPSHGIRILMAYEPPFQSQSKTERRMHTSPRSTSSLKETSIVPNIKRRQRQGESRTLADLSGQIQGQSDTSGLLVYSGRPHSQDGFPEFVYVSAFVFSPVIFRTKAS
jgi:hypothetical protein